ncbi:hypothetical protein O181_060919 [Austropuccinia psidii MF-1]|uniref:Uncharacterized protein n=1 Tax=Austropuccinia psidii MF-1 TaxID=1389203 RepID=A0A9Q3EH57_9BASI|nr:hypothetical protein [Austropuccinia psidii MF-1]
MPKQVSVVSPNKNTDKEEFVINQLGKQQVSPPLSSKIRQELTDVLYKYRNEFSSDNEPLGAIRGHEVDITLSIHKSYPPVLRRPDYPESLRTREALEKHMQQLMKKGLLRKVEHN